MAPRHAAAKPLEQQGLPLLLVAAMLQETPLCALIMANLSGWAPPTLPRTLAVCSTSAAGRQKTAVRLASSLPGQTSSSHSSLSRPAEQEAAQQQQQVGEVGGVLVGAPGRRGLLHLGVVGARAARAALQPVLLVTGAGTTEVAGALMVQDSSLCQLQVLPWACASNVSSLGIGRATALTLEKESAHLVHQELVVHVLTLGIRVCCPLPPSTVRHAPL